MRYATPIFSVVLLVAIAAVLFQMVQRRLSEAAFAFTVNPEVLEMLEQSLNDQRELARLLPQESEVYRQRFAEAERTVHRLQILSHSRDALVKRYETILLVAFAVIVFSVAGISIARHLRLQPRLDRLKDALAALAAGSTDIEVGAAGRDVVGRIAAMIEQTSRVMARDRRRLAELSNLSSWQEAARRQAHEMRTPLTGARLEIERLRDLLKDQQLKHAAAVDDAAGGALQEIDRLGAFARRFTSFARLPKAQLEPVDLGAEAMIFLDSFGAAWSNLDFDLEAAQGIAVALDREMMRQVLTNLCDNSSRSLGSSRGSVQLRVTSEGSQAVVFVSDNGPGVDQSIRDRLFEPYASTRAVGEGMGLGLAISKKIMLDFGGDLELYASSSKGTTMRLTLPLIDSKDSAP